MEEEKPDVPVEIKQQAKTGKETSKQEVFDIEEGKRHLVNLFRDYDINRESKWDRVYESLAEDDRFHLIKSVKDRKQIFKEFVQQKKDEHKKNIVEKKQRDKTNFKQMLTDYTYITVETKFQSLIPIFFKDPRWACLDDKEKEEAFEEYIEEIFIRKNEDEKEINKRKCEMVKKQLLELKSVTSSTTWDEIKEIMYHDTIWNELHDYYKLETFSEFIKNLREIEQKEIKKEREKKELRHRLAYRRYIEKEIREDMITFKTAWGDYIKKLKDQECLYNLIGQDLARPRDVFFDYTEVLAEVQAQMKDAFKSYFKSNLDQFPRKISQEEFSRVLERENVFRKLKDHDYKNSTDFYSSYLYKQLIKRQKKSVGKLLKFFYKKKVDKDTDIGQLKDEIRRSDNRKYLESLCEDDKRELLQIYKGYLGDTAKLKAYVKKMNGKKDREKEDRERDRSDSEDMEQGEIKMESLKRVKRPRQSSQSPYIN